MTTIRLLIATSLLACTAAAYADSFEDVEKKINELQKKITSYSAKMDMNTKIQQGPQTMEQSGDGTFEYLVKGDDKLFRIEMNVKMNMGGMEMTGKQLTICDGEYALNIAEQMGQKQGFKTKADDAQGTVGPDMLDSIKKDFDLSLGEDTEVNGDKCWTLLGKPKQALGPMAPKSFKYHIRQSDGVMLQMLGINEAGEPMMTMNWTDIKLNEKIDSKHFELVVPEGVNVIDQTGDSAPTSQSADEQP